MLLAIFGAKGGGRPGGARSVGNIPGNNKLFAYILLANMKFAVNPLENKRLSC